MSTVEDRLASAARELRRDVERHVDVDTALARVEAPQDPLALPVDGRSRRSWRPMVAAAAVAAAVAIVAGLIATDDEEPVVSHQGSSSTTTETSTTTSTIGVSVPFRVAGKIAASPLQHGSISYAGTVDAFADQWGSGTDQPVPAVDFEQELVLMVTVPRDEFCEPPLARLVLDGGVLTPVFEAGEVSDCDYANTTLPRTFAIAIDPTSLPRTFAVVLFSDPDDGYTEQRLDIDLSLDAQEHVPRA